MHTPFFPAFRARLAALGRRTTHAVRQATLDQLQEHLRDFLPAPLLAAEDEGANSRERKPGGYRFPAAAHDFIHARGAAGDRGSGIAGGEELVPNFLFCH